MPRIPNTTDSQSAFLRAFRTSPSGPPADAWPSPSILRRWLRHPGFKRAFDSLQETLHAQLDFHLTVAAGQAARRLAADCDDPATAISVPNILSLVRSARDIPSPEPESDNDDNDDDDESDDDDNC